MATRYAELAGRLEHLSKPANVFAGFGVSDALSEAAAAITALEAELDEARRISTDRLYFMQAFQNMLGPIGLKVVAMWKEKRVKRVHHSWGPDAAKLTGEERAQFILDFEAAASRAVPVGSVDAGLSASIESKP